jgi:hypothetical protein
MTDDQVAALAIMARRRVGAVFVPAVNGWPAGWTWEDDVRRDPAAAAAVLALYRDAPGHVTERRT